MNIIISHGFGSFSAWAATVSNAKTILSWQYIPLEVETLSRALPSHYITYEAIATLIQKMLKSKDGDVIFKSRVDGEEIVATQAARQETVLYLFERNVSLDTFSPYQFKQWCNIKDLSWLAQFHDITLTDRELIESAKQYRAIQNDGWKEGATELNKIRFILEFVNMVSHRDEKYEIVEVREIAS